MKILRALVLSIFLAACFSSPALSQKATPQISSFNAGEISPKLDNRTDLDKYYSSNRTMENFIPLVEGGAARMPGTYFVLETKDSTQASRLIPFQFSTTQAYVIEAGHQYFRFYKDDGQINTVDTSTKLLLHMDGADAGVTFTDSGTDAVTVTTNADAQIDTAQYKFVTASGLFDGTGDFITAPDSASWFMSTGTFTIDFWVRVDDVSASAGGLIGSYDDANNSFRIWTSTLGVISFNYYNAAGAPKLLLASSAAAIVDDTWYHIAVIRGWGGNANDWALCIDGTAVDTDTVADAMPNLADTLNIGKAEHSAGTYYLGGWMDEVRVSKGVARWQTTGFTPPTQEYPFVDVVLLTGGGAIVYEVPAPYDASDLFEIKTFQSADILYLLHPDYRPKQLSRTGHASWTLTDLQTKVGATMTITGITQANPAVISASTVPATLVSGDVVYVEDVVGMTEVNNLFFTAGSVSAGSPGTFTLNIDGVTVDCTGCTAYSSGGTTVEQLYGNTDNRPSCGTFFEERMALAGANDNPQTVNLSVNADYDNFTLGSDDDDALQYTIASDKVDRVYWMLGQDYLMIGTVGGVWRMGATTTGDPVTPSNIVTKKQVSLGVKNIEPKVVTDSVLWVTRGGTSVRQLAYSLELDKFLAPDMTRLAKHIAIGDSLANSGMEQIDFQREPLPLLWAVRSDGQLLGMTYEIQEQLYSWFRVVTDGEFESVAVISEEDQEDQVWLIVKRTIDGNDVRYVEYFKPHEFYGDIDDAFFVHSGLSWDGTAGDGVTAIKTLNGLAHLEGETLSVLGDGLVQGNETVSSGSITIDTLAIKIHVGLPYTSILEPMKLSFNMESGSIRGTKQRINQLLVNFYQTGYGVEFGPSQTDLKDFVKLTAGALTTDALKVTFHSSWDDESTISIVQSDPLPVTVLGIVPWVTVNP